MHFLRQVFDWFADGDNWFGGDGLVHLLRQHLAGVGRVVARRDRDRVAGRSRTRPLPPWRHVRDQCRERR